MSCGVAKPELSFTPLFAPKTAILQKISGGVSPRKHAWLKRCIIDERQAMGSKPNLASKSEVVSIYKCPYPQKTRGLSP